MTIKLPNAPLQEVLLEVFWDLQLGPRGEAYDPDFELALGQFAREATGELPFHEVVDGRLDSMMAPRVWHRFRKDPEGWPVVQIGPGLLTVNDTEQNYIWKDNFYPLIKDALHWLEASYASKLTFAKGALRYIDFLKFVRPEMGMAEFVNNYLNLSVCHGLTSLDFPDGFFQRMVFKVGNETVLTITLSDGQKNMDGQGAIMEIALIRESPMEVVDLLEWLPWAHELASNTFRESIKPDLYEHFK